MKKPDLKSPMFWAMVSILLAFISAIIYGNGGGIVFHYAIYVFWIYPLLIAITAIVFAWVVNPIKALIAWIKNKLNKND